MDLHCRTLCHVGADRWLRRRIVLVRIILASLHARRLDDEAVADLPDRHGLAFIGRRYRDRSRSGIPAAQALRHRLLSALAVFVVTGDMVRPVTFGRLVVMTMVVMVRAVMAVRSGMHVAVALVQHRWVRPVIVVAWRVRR